MKKEVKRLNFNITMDMHEWLQETADMLGIPVSALVVMAIHHFRESDFI